ncbi:hypothetical protein BD289DRAFT_407141 [Coniella lustricola]|uniref:Ketoreductase domain-containing protein n=1 Tax=Coniella lustricola TaxID=2025994 RepID=A0A2T3ABN2_9PEZI|nr:hypothetical protein BD289DRAFT_407141 [Coniella lustricola]
MASLGGFDRPPQRDSWFAPMSVDLVLKVLKVSLFHPFVAWMIPLCFRAEHMDWDKTPIRFAVWYAVLVTVCWTLALVNRRIAFGLPRKVNLADEVIVITGGASGLGLLIAEVYGMRGASVAVLDVKEMENGEARGVTFYKCDVTNKEQLARVARQIEQDLGPPTVLINNAAVVVGKSLLDMSMDEVDKSLTTNLLSSFYALKTFLPAIIRSGTGGTIVTMSSVLGQVGAAQLSDYAAAKAGLIALHKSLTAELRQTHPEVRTVLVTPGQLSTPLFYGVQTPHPFIAPVVEPVDIAKEIISAIDNGNSEFISAPLYAQYIDWYNVLPLGVQRLVRRLAGVDGAMKSFVGRQGNELSEKNGHVL